MAGHTKRLAGHPSRIMQYLKGVLQGGERKMEVILLTHHSLETFMLKRSCLFGSP
jgi:hypothetical protein